MNDFKEINISLLTCPACASEQVQKYGKTRAGSQRYRCLKAECRRQFVPGSNHLIDPEIKSTVMRMIAADIHPRQIYKAINPDGEEKISLRWIYTLKRRKKNDDSGR